MHLRQPRQRRRAIGGDVEPRNAPDETVPNETERLQRRKKFHHLFRRRTRRAHRGSLRGGALRRESACTVVLVYFVRMPRFIIGSSNSS